MISGLITDTQAWKTCPSPIVEMVQILSDPQLLTKENGKYEVKDKFFYVLMDYITKPYAEVRPEAHTEHLDVQVVLEGEESMGWVPLTSENTIHTPYDNEKDVVFYNSPKNYNYISCIAGYSCVFFPWDIHSPGIVNHISQKASFVRKVVGKIHMSLLQ